METIVNIIKELDSLALYEAKGEEIEEITEETIKVNDIVSTLLFFVDDIKEKIGKDLTDLFIKIDCLEKEVERLKKSME